MWRRLVPYLVVPVLAGFIGSLRIRWCGTDNIAEARKLAGPIVFAFWHENITHFAWTHRHRGVRVMVSRHGDGEMAAKLVELLGFRTARGSSSRGGVAALKEMARAAGAARDVGAADDVALTPDGPRGPRHSVQTGVVSLAARSGLPIVPAAVSYERCWRLGSWDRMPIPRPFTRSVVAFGPALLIPPHAPGDTAVLEEVRQQLEVRMRELVEHTESDFSTLYAEGHRRVSDFDPKPRRTKSSTPQAAE